MATIEDKKKKLEDAPVNDPARVPVSFGARTVTERPSMATPLPRTSPVPPTPSMTFVPGSITPTESNGEYGVSRSLDVILPRFETPPQKTASPVEQAFAQRTKTLANAPAPEMAAAPTREATGQQPPAYLSNPSGALYRNPAHPDTPNYIPKDFDLAKANAEWDARVKASEAAETRGVDFGRRSQASGNQGNSPIQITKQPNGVTEIWDRTSGEVRTLLPGDGDLSATNRHMAQLTSGDPKAYAALVARTSDYEAGLKNADTGAFRGETERSLVPSQIRENNARADSYAAKASAIDRQEAVKETTFKPFTQASEDGSETTLFYNEADPTNIIDPRDHARGGQGFEAHVARVKEVIEQNPAARRQALDRLRQGFPEKTKIIDRYFP